MATVPALQFDNWQWLSLTLAAPVVVWGALPFHRAALANLRHGAATMDTLISIGTLAAFGWSLYALFFGDAGMVGMKMPFDLTIDRGSGADEIYLEVAAAVTTFILAGRYFEARAKRRAGAALQALLELGAKDVVVVRGGREERIAVDDLKVGDRFVARPGEKIATDGVVEEGSSAIDASLLTGESVPVEVSPGDPVTGATLNAGGRLVVRATRVGADTQLAQIGRLVVDAQNGKAAVQRLADRISAVFVPVVIALAVATLGVLARHRRRHRGGLHRSGGGSHRRLPVRARPRHTDGAARRHRPRRAARHPHQGTGGPRIHPPGRHRRARQDRHRHHRQDGARRRDHRARHRRHRGRSASSALWSTPQSIRSPVRSRPAPPPQVGLLPTVDSFTNREGLGVEGIVEGHAVVAGRVALLEEWALHLPADLVAAKDAAESRAQTAVVAGWDGEIRAVIVVADTVKATSAEAIRQLRDLGLHPVLLTGDNEASADAVAAQVGIDDVIAEVLPAEKVDVVRRLQREGRVVAMVGDGVNDAAALAQADLGLSMGTGTDAAIEASDLTLVRGDLRAAPDAIRLARRTLATIKTNLFWAFAYNVAAIPLAAAGFLNPMIAGAAMALSSVFVVSNSLRLRRFAPLTSHAAA